jgi:FkbM family methyltransferase
MTPASEPIRPSVLRYRLLRGLLRSVSPLFLGHRKRVVERVLRLAFGETVEARGHLLHVDPRDRMVGARLRRRGVWDRAETELYERCVRPGDRVIDVGAHVGYFSLLFARLVGPQGCVRAFEPEPRNFELLERNIARNGYRNVRADRRALWRAKTEATLLVSEDNLGDHRLRPGEAVGERALSVSAATLDECLAGQDTPIDLLKIDVQGCEPAVFDGAHETIASSPGMLMLTEFWPDGMREACESAARYLQTVAAAGFSAAVLEDTGSLRAVSTDQDRRRLCEPGIDVNLVCWKGRSPPERR